MILLANRYKAVNRENQMRYATMALLGALYFVTSAASASQTSIVHTLSVSATPSIAAKGRTGSHRIGGTNSHGKGSHYVGGRK